MIVHVAVRRKTLKRLARPEYRLAELPEYKLRRQPRNILQPQISAMTGPAVALRDLDHSGRDRIQMYVAHK